MAFNSGNMLFPGHFNAKTDKWCEYKERMLCALDAAGVSDDAKSRSLFLSQCGKDTYSLIASLLVPQRPTNVSFRDILTILDTFYEPQTNEILEAGRFHKRLQLQGESVQDFVAAINELGSKCNYIDLKRQLRDRLVLGIQDDRLRRELLKTKQLTYEMAVQMCLNHQATFSDLYPETNQSKQTPSNDIERIVRECEQCQAVRNNPPRNPQMWVIPEKPWSRVHIDFAGPYNGKTFLILIDSYSKWPEAEIVQSPSSKSAITSLRKIFASQGLPEVLVSDNGRAFTSDEFNNFLQKNNIKHVYSPPYHPATNGQAEVTVKCIKNKLEKLADSEMPWSEKLSKALYWLRTVPNTSTNKTPAEMLNGRKYRTAISIIHPDTAPNSSERQLQEIAQRQPNRHFIVNQPVLVRMYGPGQKWCKAVVESIDGPSTYTVKTDDGQLHRRHLDQIIARSERLPISAEDNGSVPSNSSPEPNIEIPDPELWPDIIGVPRD